MILRFATSLMVKLVVLFVSVAMALIAVVGFFSYTSARSALEDAQFEKLDSMRDTQARYVQTYVADILDHLRLMLKNPNLRASLISLSWSYDAEETTATPQDKPTKDSSDGQPKIFGSQGTYDILDKNFSAFLEVRSSEDGFEDVIYVNGSDGRVIYTNKRVSDFGTNLNTGSLKDSDLGKVYREVMRTLKPYMVTFTMYGPSASPAFFIAAPVKVDDERKCTGVLAMRLNPGKIVEMMKFGQSAGKTAEAYVVDQDRMMLSDSRFYSESTVLKQRVETESAKLALENKSGHMVTDNYRGDSVFSSYAPVPLDQIKDFASDVKWALIAEIGEKQALQPAVALGRRIVGMALIVSIIVALFGFLAARTISRPVAVLAEKVTEVREGDLNVEIRLIR